MGNNLRELRERAGMTKRALAMAIGASDSRMIRRWEDGVRPSGDYLQRMADVLGPELVIDVSRSRRKRKQMDVSTCADCAQPLTRNRRYYMQDSEEHICRGCWEARWQFADY